MSMHRVCVPAETLRQPIITLSPSVAHYIRHVLRLRVGDEITVFDGAGQECLVRLTSVAATHVQGERLASLAPARPALQPCILGQALPKGAKMDLIVEKCSELGLTTLVPLHTERTVVREAPERLATKMARWQRLAVAAARQCGRPTLLDVQPPMALRDFCVRYGSAPVKLVCWEEERQQGMRQVLERVTGESPSSSSSGLKVASLSTKSRWRAPRVLSLSASAHICSAPKPQQLYSRALCATV